MGRRSSWQGPVPPVAPRKRDDIVEIRKQIEFLTPMFGGGVYIDPERPHCKPCDPVTPVRGASIRGQLRFWWRAAIGSGMESLAAMREREAQIWGAASQPGKPRASAVSLSVDSQNLRSSPLSVYQAAKPKRAVKGLEILAYGAFPLQPAEGMPPPAGTLTEFKGSFDLCIRVSQCFESDVRTALSAWLTFGGLGSRVRRGFGAVGEVDVYANPSSQLRMLSERAGEGHRGVPSLAGAQVQTREIGGEPARNWLETLWRFRQGADCGRDPGRSESSPPGRTRWPEADAIRARTQPRRQLRCLDRFPRGRFGMPLIFYWKKSGTDPETKATLLPVEPGQKEQPKRMASPLIIRPYRVDAQRTRVLALLLGGDIAPRAAHINAGENETAQLYLTAEEAEVVMPMRGRGCDPLEAFLKYFTESPQPAARPYRTHHRGPRR